MLKRYKTDLYLKERIHRPLGTLMSMKMAVLSQQEIRMWGGSWLWMRSRYLLMCGGCLMKKMRGAEDLRIKHYDMYRFKVLNIYEL